MSSYSGLPTPTLKSGSSNFIFIAVAIIIVFVVLYYSYNFLFSNIGAPVPTAIIVTAVSTMTMPSINTSFVPPYEGGDYTVSFWMYVHSNNFASGTSSYRKHIVDIGGNGFSTVAIGLDALQNNLIVRTSSGDATVSGNSLASAASALLGGSESGSYYDDGGSYITLGDQTFWSSKNSAGDASCFKYVDGRLVPYDTGCLPIPSKRGGTSGLACTNKGLIDRATGENMGWDKSCNPCDGYWVSPGSTAGTGMSDLGYTGSDHSSATFVSYSYPSNTNSCKDVCKYSDDGRFQNASAMRGGSNGSNGSNGSDGSGSCTWSNSIPTTTSTSGSVPQQQQPPSNPQPPGGSSTLACAMTPVLDSDTMDSLFNQPVAAACTDSTLPPCDIPQYDLQRWTHVTVVLSGKITDVYMNGKLARSCNGSSYFKVDSNPQVHVLAYKTFDGQLANLNLYNIALNPAQIYEMYTKGPQTK